MKFTFFNNLICVLVSLTPPRGRCWARRCRGWGAWTPSWSSSAGWWGSSSPPDTCLSMDLMRNNGKLLGSRPKQLTFLANMSAKAFSPPPLALTDIWAKMFSFFRYTKYVFEMRKAWNGWFWKDKIWLWRRKIISFHILAFQIIPSIFSAKNLHFLIGQGLDQLFVTLYALYSYPFVHKQLIRALFKAHIELTWYMS